jgi:adenine deaminase
MPDLVYVNIHTESSMITPGSLAKAAVSRGTTTIVSDPVMTLSLMALLVTP